MTPGQRYLKLLRYEYAMLAHIAKVNLDNVQYALSVYKYTEQERHRIKVLMKEDEDDYAFYSQKLADMGGAENEEIILTESTNDSESPRDKLQEISCTTVL